MTEYREAERTAALFEAPVFVEPAWIRALRTAGVVGVFVGLLSLTASVLSTPGPLMLAVVTSTVWLATVGAAVAVWTARLRLLAGRPAQLRVDGDAVRIGDRVLPRSALRSGTLTLRRWSRGDKRFPILVLVFVGETLHLYLPDLGTGRSLLRVLGLDDGRAPLVRWLVSPVNHPLVALPLALGIVGVCGGLFEIAALFYVLSFLVMALGLVRTRLSISDTAVERSWLRVFRRAVRVADIRRVEVRPAGLFRARIVRLHREGGRSFDIVVGRRGHNIFEPYSLAEESLLIAERIESAMRAAPPQ